ncbi:retinoic acid receptor RXR-alpha [Trichechus manatus latirostris]|uniref:Retinoic acid receptor RXR-alpha n=1 Tax=Trichechus manatus latirostris TaxID=127582 RepID=A0A2Y9S218_TRIMA|nr:retinoic acid receptor RXR-alpha [Trichechus manatus latirostris]
MQCSAVQEERQRGKDRNENEVESTSSANEDMPVEKILEAELAVEPKTETYVEATVGLNPSSVSACRPLGPSPWGLLAPHPLCAVLALSGAALWAGPPRPGCVQVAGSGPSPPGWASVLPDRLALSVPNSLKVMGWQGPRSAFLGRALQVFASRAGMFVCVHPRGSCCLWPAVQLGGDTASAPGCGQGCAQSYIRLSRNPEVLWKQTPSSRWGKPCPRGGWWCFFAPARVPLAHFGNLSGKDGCLMVRAVSGPGRGSEQAVLRQPCPPPGWNELLIASFSHRSIAVKDGILLATGLHVHRNSAHSAGVGAIFDRWAHVLAGSRWSSWGMGRHRAARGEGDTLLIQHPERLDDQLPQVALAGLFPKPTPCCCVPTFAKLLLRLPALRSIGLKCLEHLFFFKLIGDTPIDTFLMEMLEAPHQMT